MKVKKPKSNNKAMRYHISYKYLWWYCERDFRITDMLQWTTHADRIRRRLYPPPPLPPFRKYSIDEIVNIWQKCPPAIQTVNEDEAEYIFSCKEEKK